MSRQHDRRQNTDRSSEGRSARSIGAIVATLMAVVLSLLAGCSDNSGAGGVTAKADKHPGEETYNRFCFSCHASGVAGAPKFGDVEAWAPRLAKGRELLLQSTREGIAPGMPVMGLCTSCTAEDLENVVDYMILTATPAAEAPQ